MEGPKSFSIEALLAIPTSTNKDKMTMSFGSSPITGSLDPGSPGSYESMGARSCVSPNSVDSIQDEDSREEGGYEDPMKQRSNSESRFVRGSDDPGMRSRSGLIPGDARHVHDGAGLNRPGGLNMFYRFNGQGGNPAGSGVGPGSCHPGAAALSMLAAGSAFHSPNAPASGGAHHPQLPHPSTHHPGGSAAPGTAAIRMAQAHQHHMQNLQLDWLARAGVFIPRIVDFNGQYIIYIL